MTHTASKPRVLQGVGGRDAFLVVLYKALANQVFALLRDVVEGGMVKVILGLHNVLDDLWLAPAGEWHFT